jgi:UDP-glucose:(glucosyl)LPS alpha-1,2-glucosyltransferase
MKPMGGTELLLDALHQRLDPELLNSVQIVSRPENIDQSKKQVLWVHDLPADMPFMTTTSGRAMFDGIVYVSSWQQQIFNLNADVPFTGSTVIRNAIEPIDIVEKEYDGKIRLIYHPTPHRGLEILVPVFVELAKKYQNLHLDVFSNFDLYARPELNEKYENLYNICREHDKITYHGTQPNSVVRDALKKAHIFAYPSIWRETSCLCAMEAMSAKCLTVAPNYGALPETLANFAMMYDFNENLNAHAQVFAYALETAINRLNSENTDNLLNFQKAYADSFYSWDSRIGQWETYLKFISEAPKKKSGGLTWNPR